MSITKDKYKKVAEDLKQEFGYKNTMQIPKVEKVVVNICAGREAVQSTKVVNVVADELAKVTGKKPQVARAKKAISNFKLRQNMPIGCYVTLRREKMWAFLDRLFNVALPRVRDFKGISPKAFDGRGNYNLGLKEQIVFPEINYDKIDKLRGMNITICTSANSDAEAKKLLDGLGCPFRK